MIDKMTVLPSFGSQLQPLASQPDASAETNFMETLNQALNEINELQKESAVMAERFVAGEVTDLHQVMIAAEKARLGMELMLEIRNRLFEGYQEIMRMQI